MNHPGFKKELIVLIVFLLVLLLACCATAIRNQHRLRAVPDEPIRIASTELASSLMEEIACH